MVARALNAPAIAVHGGAGRVSADPDHVRRVADGLRAALAIGGELLAAGASALEAVAAAVRELERCPVFNAGRGGALDRDGAVSLDAMVMEGSTRRAGGVIGVARIQHPVDAAMAVLRDGRHVLLAGAGAERFARAAGIAAVDPAYHVTEERRAQLARAIGERAPSGGTVGAVARDREGHLAVATSTGGLSGKLPGRISDSALIGCGTWADDATCAVSATGQGEYFIRAAFARSVDARLRHAGASLEQACADALAEVAALGGHGGCIAVGSDGEIRMAFDTQAMARGALHEGEEARVALGRE